jgi:hypothetical protein
MGDTGPLGAAYLIIDNINNSTTDNSSRIFWQLAAGYNLYWGKKNANGGLVGHLCSSDDSLGRLSGISESVGNNPLSWPELEWIGWLRLAGKTSGQNTLIEFGTNADFTGTRSQIRGAVTSPGNLFQSGIDFVSVAGSGAGTATYICTIGVGHPSAGQTFFTQNPFAAMQPLGTATSGANFGSTEFHLLPSVWDGSAAKFRTAFLAAVPAAGANGKVALNVKFLDPATSYAQGSPRTSFSINQDGTFFFGYLGTSGITNDPSLVTAARTVTWPDIAGGNLVIPGTTGSAPTSAATPGTAGQCIIDATGNVYICYKTGAAGSANWTKLTGVLV